MWSFAHTTEPRKVMKRKKEEKYLSGNRKYLSFSQLPLPFHPYFFLFSPLLLFSICIKYFDISIEWIFFLRIHLNICENSSYSFLFSHSSLVWVSAMWEMKLRELLKLTNTIKFWLLFCIERRKIKEGCRRRKNIPVVEKRICAEC